MYFEINEVVLYNYEVLRVWDYSPRTNSYTLRDTEEKEYKVHETDLVNENIKGLQKYTEYFIKKLDSANREVNHIGGYAHTRDMGIFLVKLYNEGLLTSMKFNERLLQELVKFEEETNLQVVQTKVF